MMHFNASFKFFVLNITISLTGLSERCVKSSAYCLFLPLSLTSLQTYI